MRQSDICNQFLDVYNRLYQVFIINPFIQNYYGTVTTKTQIIMLYNKHKQIY